MQLRTGDPENIGGYALQARLGSGGMGTVFLARAPSGRLVAIKLIHQQLRDDEEFLTRFRQEVAAVRRVSGAFTAAVVDAAPDADHPWMATTYITGPTLAQRIDKDGALGGAELRSLAIGLVEALRDIHRAKVVHRDLKPSNVVLSPDGPRVIDFGISRAIDHQTLTMTGRVIGTPPFMSPEQLRAPRQVGPESDVFSLATLLVYAATGQGPFDADSPYMTAYQVVHEAPVLAQVPEALRMVLEPCLAKERAERPTADELLEQLLALPEELTSPPGAAAAAAARDADPDTRLLSPRTRERLKRAKALADGKGEPGGHGLGEGAPGGPGDGGPDDGGPDDGGPGNGPDDEDLTLAALFAAVGDPTSAAEETHASRGRSAAGGRVGDQGAAADPGSAADPEGAADPGSTADPEGAADPGSTASPDGPHGPRDPADRTTGPGEGTAGPTATARSAAAGSFGAHRLPFSARALRGRWRTVLAAAVAAAAISTGVTLLSSTGAEQRSAKGAGHEANGPRPPAAGRGAQGASPRASHASLDAATDPLPPGFRPWRVRVPSGQELTDEMRCVAQGDSVYCGGGGVLAVRLRAADGTQVWKRLSPGAPALDMYIVGVTGDTVIGYRMGADDTETIVALSTATGRELWSARPADNSAVLTGRAQDAVLLDSRVFSADPAGTGIEARDAHSGTLSWSAAFPGGSECTPVAAGPHLYALCAPQQEVAAVDVTHTTLRTVDPATGALGRPVAVDGRLWPVGEADGSLILLKERQDTAAYRGFTKVVRLDTTTGRITSTPLPPNTGTTPGLADGTLYFAGTNGRISAVDPRTGRQKWSVQTVVEAASGPVLGHGVLYFSSTNGRVAALEESDGRQRWTTDPRSNTVSVGVGMSARVVLAGGALIATAGGNTVFGFDTARPPKPL